MIRFKIVCFSFPILIIYSTIIPILRAVPDIVLIAASISKTLRSFIFISAICLTLATVTFPTFVLFGSADPFAIPAACFKRTEAGGDFVIKVKVLSEYTVITTGIIVPSFPFVCALIPYKTPLC